MFSLHGSLFYIHGYNKVKEKIEPIYNITKGGYFVENNYIPLESEYFNSPSLFQHWEYSPFQDIKVAPYYRRFYEEIKILV